MILRILQLAIVFLVSYLIASILIYMGITDTMVLLIIYIIGTTISYGGLMFHHGYLVHYEESVNEIFLDNPLSWVVVTLFLVLSAFWPLFLIYTIFRMVANYGRQPDSN